jgi:D-alanyl-D-alanine carboxypeptidase
MKSRTFVIGIMAMVFCTTVLFGGDRMQSSEKAERELGKFIKPDGPGLQYVIVDKDSRIFESSLGLSNVKANIDMVPSQTMAAFSMTKTITAIAVLQLAEQNRLNIDDLVSNYIEHPYDQGITIRQLISHTSGIGNPIPLKWVHPAENHAGYNESDELEKILKEYSDPASDKGTKYIYSNIGYWLLGGIVEKASGEQYIDYVHEHIFAPLGLSPSEMGFVISNKENHAKGYIKKWSFMNLAARFLMDKSVFGDNEGRWVSISSIYLNGPSYGGLIGTAGAFGRILQDLLSGGSIVLGSAGKQQLYSRQTLESGKNVVMTLGWHIGKMGDVTYYFKEGGGPGFCGEMRVYPDSGLASVLILNRTSFNFKKDMSKIDKNFLVSN